MKKSLSLLLAASTLSLSTGYIFSATAQTSNPNQTEDEIVVYGQRAALDKALREERASDNLIEVLASDAIGQLPDENAAEAIRRAVGTNIFNDQGEGRFVSIRGLDPSLNSVSVNGVQMTSPEGDQRAVPLDVIDADVLERVVITKALTPDMDADAIGGNIELKTLSGIDQEKMLLNLKVGGVYTDQTEEFGERFSAAYADNFLDGRLGFAGSASWQSREFGSENKEADGGEWNFDNALPFPEELEFRDYLITRERLSVSGNVDYMVTDNQRIFLTAFYNDFSDQEFRSRVETKLGDGVFSRIEGNNIFLQEEFDTAEGEFSDGVEVDRDVKDRKESQTLFSVILGHEWEGDFGKFDATLSFAQAEEEEPNRLDSDFAYDGGTDGVVVGEVGVDVSDRILPNVVFGDAATEAAFNNPDLYEYDGSELLNGVTTDEEFAAAVNLQLDDVFGDIPGYLKTGAKIRLRTASRNVDVDVIEVDDVTLGQFAQTLDFALDNLGPVPNPSQVRDFVNSQDQGDFERDLVASNEADFDSEENIYAAYIMGSGDFDALRVVGGLRVEHTEFEGEGRNVNENIDPDLENITFLTNDKSYTDWLPSINARYNFAENVIGRASYYRS
ncbi:MAG: TonB-dependent receptor, partial [Pseudomonadota bacterium]